MLWYCVTIVQQQAVLHRRTSLAHTTTTSTDILAVMSSHWFVTKDYDAGGVMDLWSAKIFTARHADGSCGPYPDDGLRSDHLRCSTDHILHICRFAPAG